MIFFSMYKTETANRARKSCLKINKCYVVFEISNFEILSKLTQMADDKPETLRSNFLVNDGLVKTCLTKVCRSWYTVYWRRVTNKWWRCSQIRLIYMKYYLKYIPLHTGLIGSRFLQNYAFKGWLSLETMWNCGY